MKVTTNLFAFVIEKKIIFLEMLLIKFTFYSVESLFCLFGKTAFWVQCKLYGFQDFHLFFLKKQRI